MPTVLSQSDFEKWRIDPVTKAFFQACYERVEELKNLLATTAGYNSVEDNYNRGFIAAYSEIPYFRIEDLSDGD